MELRLTCYRGNYHIQLYGAQTVVLLSKLINRRHCFGNKTAISPSNWGYHFASRLQPGAERMPAIPILLSGFFSNINLAISGIPRTGPNLLPRLSFSTTSSVYVVAHSSTHIAGIIVIRIAMQPVIEQNSPTVITPISPGVATDIGVCRMTYWQGRISV